jgi:hemerythrin superfamily protein
MTDVQHRSDIVMLLERDHQSIEAMFSRFDAEPMSRWDQVFCDLTHTLVAHEVAEEQVVYPALRRDAPGGEQIADSCIHEQSAAEELLDVMERDGVEAPEFPTRLAELRRAVLAHAQHEEREVFPALRAVEDTGRRDEIGRRYERAKSMAPTHPHPHAPDTPPGNVTLGPVTALVDRMRDAMSRD